ncbi:MAG: glycine--tRNA ligase subunit beta [Chloroflexi bacterium]|nr:glycine--tRNA ligase subunit beta [Chloroflexota bacterium]
MALNFQQVILKLHEFWAAQGCVIWNPYNVQVGAGTNNPATLLRVLGPEPWRVAYVEPSVRPDDGRYGDNPNRMQYYFQYQVILKPDPGNPQEIYLQSLEALGINPRQHDIRFVEDNWESPGLGAWGLGWEVWLDGQEITQFTYFQQAGGLELDPVAVEITYGLERIVLALQGKDAAWDIEWVNELLYKDIFLQSEIEHCKYYFEIADIDGLKKVFEVYENEHRRALAAGLLIPAYDYVLKCNHLFNVLDTRGAIGVTERAFYFRKMRDMTRNVAKAFAAQRAEAGYPLHKLTPSWGAPTLATTAGALPPPPTAPADVLFEIGVEELPASDFMSAHEQLEALAQKFFEELRLPVQAVAVFGTPRRLVLAAYQVAPRQADSEKVEKGPPADRAFDKDGKPTKAAEGFAKSRGLRLEDLRLEEIDGGKYVTALVKTAGRPATEVLAEALPGLIANLKFAKTMRWNSSAVAFSRPIRWLLALFGGSVIPFTYAGVASGSSTRGLRPYGSPHISVRDSADYFQKLKEHGVILNQEHRRQHVLEHVRQMAAHVGGYVPDDEGLLWEVTNLVEMPTALMGSFDEKYLQLPRAVLVTVMRDKQRYFPVENADGALMPYFITVRNGDKEHLDTVTHGNEHVLSARFSDATFFYNEDRKTKLDEHLPRLATLTFQEQLGSMLDKNQRIVRVVETLGRLFEIDPWDIMTAKRASHILKADLATQMVIEMTSLQGTMGREYALLESYPQEVANAIYEHWLPRGADDELPFSPAGTLLALADRLDSLVGLFAAGLAPKSTADPYGLRRAALGIVQILLDRRLSVDLRRALEILADVQPITVSAEAQTQALEFISGRLEVWLRDQGWPADIVAAVLAEQAANPYRALEGVRQLKAWTQRGDWATILDGFARCVRITRAETQRYQIHSALFQQDEERTLYSAYQQALSNLSDDENVDGFMNVFLPMLPAVTAFFGTGKGDGVLVHAQDTALRHNRLALLQAISAMQHGRADFSRLTGF